MRVLRPLCVMCEGILVSERGGRGGLNKCDVRCVKRWSSPSLRPSLCEIGGDGAPGEESASPIGPERD
jgi:hypothetical protein